MFTKSVVSLPFDEFAMDVLRTLNVASTQLNPNSSLSLRAFRLLAEMFRLRPSPHVYLSYYSARPSDPVKRVSLVSQSNNVLFTPFSSSYKYFKDSFFKFLITPIGRQHFSMAMPLSFQYTRPGCREGQLEKDLSFADQAPHADIEKRKRKDKPRDRSKDKSKDRKHSSSLTSPKRSRPSAPETSG